MNRVRLSREIGEEAIHGGVVGGKAICLDGLAEHLSRSEPSLPSLASILSIGPGTKITPKTQCKLFGPLFGCVNSWEVRGEPTAHSKQARHVIDPNSMGKIDRLMKPGETPGIPFLVHAIAIKGCRRRKQFWRLWGEDTKVLKTERDLPLRPPPGFAFHID